VEFTVADLSGTYVIDLEPIVEDLGFYAGNRCSEAFAGHALNAALAQCSVPLNQQAGIRRGMHCQVALYQERWGASERDQQWPDFNP
jgi:dTDP-4-dehydrorhamnose 3,5-epimerase-like enzyme